MIQFTDKEWADKYDEIADKTRIETTRHIIQRLVLRSEYYDRAFAGGTTEQFKQDSFTKSATIFKMASDLAMSCLGETLEAVMEWHATAGQIHLPK